MDNHISSYATRSKMKECIEALQELRCIQQHDVTVSLGLADMSDLSLVFIPEECVNPANEANVIILFDNLQNFPLLSEFIIRI